MREVPTRPLTGLTVVQLGTSTGAAYCALLLGWFGARVCVAAEPEPTERDRFGAAASSFLDDGKEFALLTLDDVAATADIVVRDAESDPLGMAPEVEHERLLAASPELTYVVVSPFGVSGPLAGARGVDLTAQALGGMAAVVGNPSQKPLSVPYELAGLSQGLHAAGAVLARLLAPKGKRPSGAIDIAASEVIASYTRMYTLLYRFYGWRVSRAGRRAPGSGGRYPMTILPCKDGYVVLIGRSRRDWERYLTMMGRPQWSEDPKYQDPLKIAVEYADEMDELVGAWLANYTRDELTALAHEHGVPLGAVRTVSEVFGDRQMRYRRFFQPGRSEGNSALRPTFPAKFLADQQAAGPRDDERNSTWISR